MENIDSAGPTSRTVGQNVRAHRTAQSMTLKVLAERMTSAGYPLSLNTLSKLERGERSVSVDELEMLARLLGVPLGELMTPRVLARQRDLEVLLHEWSAVAEALDQARYEAAQVCGRIRRLMRDEGLPDSVLQEAMTRVMIRDDVDVWPSLLDEWLNQGGEVGGER